jgi:cytosine/adenosine deaminase-related metal-dependent hydrolase
VYVRGGRFCGLQLPTYGKSFSATRRRLPGVLITPGLKNWHCHLELSSIRRPADTWPGEFVEWLLEVMRQGPASGEDAERAARAGGRQSLASGVTQIVDITRHPSMVRPGLADPLAGELMPLVTSCAEVVGLAERLPAGHKMLDHARTSEADCINGVSPGLSPHAVYSTAGMWYGVCAGDARSGRMPLTTHLCETPEERLFLAQHTGAFRELWNRIGGWSDDVDRHQEGPVHYLDQLGVFDDTDLLAAHVNDVTDDELALLARKNVTVVHCPRTHAYFRRPAFEYARYQRAGVRVVLGTDSAASSGDLNLLEDVRLFATLNPKLSAPSVLQMAMSDGLRAESSSGTGAEMAAWRVDMGLAATGDMVLERLVRGPAPRLAGVYLKGRWWSAGD